MNQFKILFLAVVSLCFAIHASAKEKPHAVIITGTHHYTPQKTMPGFAAELERLGFETTVINPDWDPEKDKRGLPGLEVLDDADVAVFFVRFLKLEDDQLKHITDYVESGKPVVGFRTSGHAFNYPKDHPHEDLNNAFGRDVLGSPYQIHLSGKTQMEIPEGAEHPILTGVTPGKWESPGTLYLTKLEPGIVPFLQGTGKSKPGTRKNQFGTYELKAEMTDTTAWTWENKWGGKAFYTSLGHAGDFAVPQSMRIMVNGVFWAAGQPIPSADTEIKTLGKAQEKKVKAEAKPKDAPNSEKKTKVKKEKPASKNDMPDVSVESDGLTVFYGNSFVERQLEEGTLEALLQAVGAGKNLRFRSLAYTGDEVGFQIRPEKFGDHLGYITSQLPCERVVMCFGMNESFAGAAGLEDFKKALELNLTIIEDRHPGAKYILVSPTAVEDMAGDNFPDAEKRNEDIFLYSNAIWEIAKKRGVEFVDLFSPSKELYAQADEKLTSNGLHLNEAGNKAIAKILAAALSDPEKVALIKTESPGFESLRKLITRKNYEMEMAYKPANGIHYYGVRGRPYEYSPEIPHHLKLAIQLDDSIWSQASDLATAHPFPELPTAQAEPPNNKPRKGLGVLQSPEEDMKGFEVADGFEVNLFASSEEFPELINPLQMNFDTKGRLWVVSYSSYPVPIPGTMADDKVLIFEDTNNDGKADKRTVFADGLKLPDGFVFYKNGIILSVARQILFLADTDGDDVADVKQELLRGVDDTDTHHSGYLARTPQGQIILNEGLFHRGQLETPYGVVRSRDAATFLFDAATEQLTIERQPSHPNPWKITFNRWGESMQMFGGGHIIDCDFYNISTPPGVSSASNMQLSFRHDKGIAISYVTGTQFPKEWMGSTVSGHLLAMNAVLYTPLKIENGTRVEADKPVYLLSSKNKVFRPTDLEFGLDGALYVTDFYYPIIGHAQHSIRDENRDYSHGRIWRVVYKDNPLSKAPQIDGADLKSLFGLFTHPQVRVRELVRLELENRPAAEVLAYANSMIEQGMKNEEFGLELLWLYERNKDFSHPELFRSLVKSDSLPIKRAAARSLRWWAPSLGEEAKNLATELLKTDDDRTKIAIVSVASHLLQEDDFWKNLVNEIKPASSTPLEVVVNLAKLYDRPALSPEFPILKLSDDTKLTNLLMDKGGNSGALYLKAPEATSLILSYEGNPYMNLDVNGIPMHRAAGTQHTKGGQINLTLKPGLNVINFFSAVNGKPKGGKIDLRLSDPTGQKPANVAFAKDKAEHEQWQKTYEDEFATVTDEHIYIKTIPAAMEFNVQTFTVKAGKKYDFIFENLDHMLHNIVITKPGKAEAVGELADTMASSPDAMAKHYIPETDLILLATEQIPYEGKVTMEFTTPTEPGEYPFICTFPGHWRLMRGVMIVE